MKLGSEAFRLGRRLFRAILRSPQVLSPKIRSGHSRLYAALPNHSGGSEIPELPSFCIAVLEEKTWEDKHRPCLLYGIALFSFDTTHKVYYQGSDVSPTLATFKWACRMLILRHVHHPDDRSRPGQSEKVPLGLVPAHLSLSFPFSFSLFPL